MSKVKVLAVLIPVGLVIAAAYAGPRLVDQTSLRAWVAPQLQRALRRGVAVEGPIDFALLPRPMVRARQVRIAGDGRTVADIPVIAAELKILPLLAGRIEPETVILTRPDIRLGSPPAAAGAAASPPASPTSPAGPAAEPSLGSLAPKGAARILIEQGTVRMGGLVLSPVDLEIVADEGSLKATGRAVAGHTGMQIDGDAEWPDGQPPTTSLSLRLDGGGVLRWNGEGDPRSADHPLTGKLTGKLADPVPLLGGLAPSLPVTLSADLTAKPDGISAGKLAVTVGDTEFDGDARLVQGAVPRAAIRLRAATLDLEKLPAPPLPPAGSAPPPAPNPAPPAAANAAGPAEPPLPFLRDMSVELSLAADQILWRGKILQDGRLDLTAGEGVIALNQARVTLPGNSEVSLVGTVSAGPRLEGSFEAKSDDLRQLLRWADLDPARVPDDRLHAARLAGKISGDAGEITFEGVRMKVDSSQIDLSAALRPGPRPALGLTFAIDSVNGDAYWSKPLGPPPPAASAAGPPPPATSSSSSAPALTSLDAGFDAEVKGTLGRLTWHGRTIQSVALDASLGHDGITLRSFSVGDLAGAQADLSGALLAGDGGLRFDHAKADLHSPDIARTLGLFGLRLPLSGPADIAADIAGTPAEPSLALTAPSLAIGKTRLDAVSATIGLPPGRVTFDHLAAGLYGGRLTGEGVLAQDGGPSSLHLALAGAQMKKALLETADFGLADGDLSGEATLASGGPPDQFEANLTGTASLAVHDGRVRGFDLKAANQKLAGRMNIGGLLSLLQAGLTGGDTQFSSLTGTARIDHGIIVCNDLALVAEGGGATGAATVNLPGDSVDAHVDFRFASARDAPPLTMRLNGSLQSPHRYLDVKPLQQWLAEHGVKTGKPKDVLKGLLKGLIR